MFASYLIFSFHPFMPTNYLCVEVNLYAVYYYQVSLTVKQLGREINYENDLQNSIKIEIVGTSN